MSALNKSRSHQIAQNTWLLILRGVITAIAVTAAGILVFALLLQWLNVSDTVIRVFNQLLKLTAIAAGVYHAVGRGGEKGLLRGALIGCIYMAAGVVLYAVLTKQGLGFAEYVADIAMGVAAGGIIGMILSNLKKK